MALPVADARHHIHLVGRTGTGKSTLLLNMILDDLKNRRGAVVIDPRGDLVGDLLDRITTSMADRVVLIDPAQDRPASFNPLEGDDPHLAVDNLVGIFSRIFQRHWGPRIDDTLRVACLTLMRRANPTLALVPPLLTDKQFRAEFTVDLDDPEGLHGYWQWYDQMNPPMRAQVIGPVLARLRQFLLRDLPATRSLSRGGLSWFGPHCSVTAAQFRAFLPVPGDRCRVLRVGRVGQGARSARGSDAVGALDAAG